jgi:hypothetical protein
VSVKGAIIWTQIDPPRSCNASFRSAERERPDTAPGAQRYGEAKAKGVRGAHLRHRFGGIASSARGQQLRRLRSRKRSWSGTLSNLSTHMSQECRRFCKETYPIYPRIETKRGDNLTCHCVSTGPGESSRRAASPVLTIRIFRSFP